MILLEWIEWVFSGIGVTIIVAIGGIIFKKRNNDNQQNIKAGKHSTNIQGGRNVNVTIGENKNGE